MNEEKHYDVEAVKQRLIDLRDLRREIENQSERLERLETKLVGVGAQALTDMSGCLTKSTVWVGTSRLE